MLDCQYVDVGRCGLVALSMASQVFPDTVDVSSLLEAARRQGFTSHGEMFSCDAMAKLAEEVITGVEASVRRDVLSSSTTFTNILMQGDLILVPYPFKFMEQLYCYLRDFSYAKL